MILWIHNWKIHICMRAPTYKAMQTFITFSRSSHNKRYLPISSRQFWPFQTVSSTAYQPIIDVFPAFFLHSYMKLLIARCLPANSAMGRCQLLVSHLSLHNFIFNSFFPMLSILRLYLACIPQTDSAGYLNTLLILHHPISIIGLFSKGSLACFQKEPGMIEISYLQVHGNEHLQAEGAPQHGHVIGHQVPIDSQHHLHVGITETGIPATYPEYAAWQQQTLAAQQGLPHEHGKLCRPWSLLQVSGHYKPDFGCSPCSCRNTHFYFGKSVSSEISIEAKYNQSCRGVAKLTWRM